jgi:HAE1 family hydrophobic/amphiphilic exporter-1
MSIAGDMRQLARTAEDVHARRLEQIAGVASVAVVGAPEDEIRIEVDPARMRALGLTPNDVSAAIRAANVNGVGGTIRRGQFRFSVRTLTEFRTPDEIRDVPVGPAGAGITLQDLATVTTTTADPKTLTRYDGTPAVGLVVYKDAGANTVAVTREIQGVVDQLRTEFPAIGLTIVAAQADFVVDALSNLGQEIVIGGILSLALILLFIRDWRMSLAIGVMIPLSVLLALVVLRWLDVTINVLSLGGLALGVGLLVDNAIVVVEASARKREEGLPLLEATIEATEEVSGPLIAGTLTTLLVFGPIIFVQGLAAALFRDLSLSVVTSVAASLVLALTLMPVMIVGRRRMNGRGREDERTTRREAPSSALGERSEASSSVGSSSRLTRVGEWFVHWYEAGMRWSLRRPGPVFAMAIVSTLFTIWVVGRMPREILPQVDEGMIVASVHLPEGTAIEATTSQVGRIEQAARALGSRGIYARVGVATDEEILAGAEPGSSATAQLLIPVPDALPAARFAERLRVSLPDLAEGALALDLAGQSEFGSLIGREGRLVRVETSARTLAEASVWADSARGRLQGIASLADVRDPNGGTQPVIEVSLRRDLLAERGITVDAVANALAGGLGGVESSDFRETDRRTPISVRLAGMANEDLQQAMATPIQGIPIAQLVQITERQAPVEVVRVGQRPVSVVEGLIESGGTAGAVDDVRAAMAGLQLPSGVTWEISGANAEQERTTRELMLVAWLSVALVFLVLAGEFASFTVPLVVMLTVPLAAVGGILFLWVTGQSINAVALIGIVVMIGMADNEAVVKLDAIRRFREKGLSVEDAVIAGGRQRLRAIAMTNITTITGVLPLILGLGSGGALYKPLAAGVIGGSVTALLVTFFLLPTAYAVMEKRKQP